MDDQAYSNIGIVATYTLHRAGKERLIRELNQELFEVQYQSAYLEAAIDKEITENPESLPVGKSLQIEINKIRIKEIKEMLERMQPKK